MISDLATRQYGVVAFRQLRDLGISPGAIQVRLEGGRIHPLHHGVYAVGHRVLTRHSRYMAAVLACGVEAALGYRSAADLHGLRRSESRIEVVVPHPAKGATGVWVHRTRLLKARDFTLVDGIRITTPARTLLDCAAVLRAVDLRRMVDRAERLELFDGHAIEELLDRAGGHRGKHRLERAIDGWRPTFTRSELEDRFLELLEAAGLELPQVNVVVAGHEVDCLWPAQRLIVQLDGFAFHRTRRDRERDAATDAHLELAGHRALRLTWGDVFDHPERTVARLRRYSIGGGPP